MTYTQDHYLQDLNTRRRSGREERGDIHTTTLPTTLKHKSPVRGWRSTHNHATYKTRTQEGGRRGDIHTTALPTRLEHKSLVRGLGGELHTSVLPTKLEHTSPVREEGEG